MANFAAIVFIISLFISFLLFKVLVKKKYIFFNTRRNKHERWGVSKKSHYGGIALILNFVFCLLIFILYKNFSFVNDKKIFHVFFILLVVTFLGLCEEKYIFSAKNKLMFQIFVSYIIIKAGFEMNLFFNKDLNFFFNLIWYLFLFNAFNMVDNIDLGYFSSIFPSFIAFIFFSYQSNYNNYYIFLLYVYFGSILTFYIFNRYPAKIFLGEVGSFQLTAVIIILSYIFFWENINFENYQKSLFNFLKNNLVFIFIFIDFFITTIRRIYLKRPIYIGDTNHISHNFTKYISVNIFSLYVICLGLLGFCLQVYFSIFNETISWLNISIIFMFYLIFLFINFMYYLLNVNKKKKYNN